MRIRTNVLRRWAGHLMVVVVLFSQSASVWAYKTAPVPARAQMYMQHDCDSKAGFVAVDENNCLQNCPTQGKQCSGVCMSQCAATELTVLPYTMKNVLPQFTVKLTNQLLMSSLNSRQIAVLERPPK